MLRSTTQAARRPLNAAGHSSGQANFSSGQKKHAQMHKHTRTLNTMPTQRNRLDFKSCKLLRAPGDVLTWHHLWAAQSEAFGEGRGLSSGMRSHSAGLGEIIAKRRGKGAASRATTNNFSNIHF